MRHQLLASPVRMILVALAAGAACAPSSSATRDGDEAVRCNGSACDSKPPTASIAAPADGATVSGAIVVTGSAADNVGVASVQIQIDDDPLQAATGTTSWTFSLDTTKYADGVHTITALATDAAHNASTAYANVTFSNSGPSLPPGAVLALHLDEPAGATTFADASGSGNDARCTAAGCPTSGVAGASRSAIQLDGVAQYLTVHGAASLKPAGALAAGAFVKATTAPDSSQTPNGYEILSMGDSYVVEVRPNGGVRFFIYDGSNWDVVDSAAVNVVDGAFHHVLGQKTATALEIYVDGTLRGSAPFSGNVSYTLGADLAIGRHGNIAARYLKGVVDEAVVYPRALTAAEISSLANGGSGGGGGDAGTGDAGSGDSGGGTGGGVAPSTYAAYKGTDIKPMPPAPSIGPANTIFNDPTFGTRILRVTDPNTASGASLFPADSGFMRTFNADASAIKLINVHGQGFWMEFNPSTFKVGDGSALPTIHPLSLPYEWTWSATNRDVLYYLNGTQLAAYNKVTGQTTNLGRPTNGYPVAYSAVVIGADEWVCSSAGWHNGVAGGESCYQDECPALFCVQPSNPSSAKLIDIVNKTINGVPQDDPNWPTFGSYWPSYPHLGVHTTGSGAGDRWVEVDIHSCSWGGDCAAIFNLVTNKWQLIRDQNNGGNVFWAGHASLGNGKYFNQGGAQFLNSGMGGPVRDPDAVLDTSRYLYVSQPLVAGDWSNDGHYSWHNSLSNPNAPILGSHYSVGQNAYLWSGELVGIAVDGSNTVYRFAHTHQNDGVAGGYCYMGDAFAQISNDGHWALFSSPWGGKLGAGNDVDCGVRLDAFIAELK